MKYRLYRNDVGIVPASPLGYFEFDRQPVVGDQVALSIEDRPDLPPLLEVVEVKTLPINQGTTFANHEPQILCRLGNGPRRSSCLQNI